MSSQNIESHIKVYWNVFYALLAFTVLTVAVSYIPFEEYTFLPFSPIFWILFVGLTIACVKGYLVSAYFIFNLFDNCCITNQDSCKHAKSGRRFIDCYLQLLYF